MHACPRYPVLQWDGTNADAIVQTGFPGYYSEDDQTGDGNLRLRSYWDYIVVVTPAAYVCQGQVYETLTDLQAVYYIVPETP